MKNVFALLFCFALVLMSFNYAPRGYKIGDTVKDFTLKSIDGKAYSLTSFSDVKGYVIVFTSNNCAYSKKYEQRLLKLHKSYADKGFPLIAINSNDVAEDPSESAADMQKLARANKYEFPYLIDEGSKICTEFGATMNAQVYVLDKKAVVQYIGAIDDNADDNSGVKNKYVEDAIQSITNGTQLEITKMPIDQGCRIKKKGTMNP